MTAIYSLQSVICLKQFDAYVGGLGLLAYLFDIILIGTWISFFKTLRVKELNILSENFALYLRFLLVQRI